MYLTHTYIFEKYIALLPEDAQVKNLFYCKQKKKVCKNDTSWYFNISVGHNQIARRLKDMHLEAGLDDSGIINHGLYKGFRNKSIIYMYMYRSP